MPLPFSRVADAIITGLSLVIGCFIMATSALLFKVTLPNFLIDTCAVVVFLTLGQKYLNSNSFDYFVRCEDNKNIVIIVMFLIQICPSVLWFYLRTQIVGIPPITPLIARWALPWGESPHSPL